MANHLIQRVTWGWGVYRRRQVLAEMYVFRKKYELFSVASISHQKKSGNTFGTSRPCRDLQKQSALTRPEWIFVA